MTPLNETDCLDDSETAAAMADINREIMQLAPALNSQSYALHPTSSSSAVPIHAVLKRVGSERYVFAVAMADGAATATFSLSGLGGVSEVEVVGEQRSVAAREGEFEDDFEPYAVHLYRVPPR